jgi:hypothetical protein
LPPQALKNNMIRRAVSIRIDDARSLRLPQAKNMPGTIKASAHPNDEMPGLRSLSNLVRLEEATVIVTVAGSVETSTLFRDNKHFKPAGSPEQLSCTAPVSVPLLPNVKCPVPLLPSCKVMLPIVAVGVTPLIVTLADVTVTETEPVTAL